MQMDEIEAFRLATASARAEGWPWRAPYWIDLVDGEWEIQAEGAYVIRVNSTTGKVVESSAILDPALALARAKRHAQESGLQWKPGFSLQLDRTCWHVGACQSQLGGQVSIQISHEGDVAGTYVNPK